MKGLKLVQKHLDENVLDAVSVHRFPSNLGKRMAGAEFTKRRAKFCKVLRRHGYTTMSEGNYIIAKNGSERVTFYFTAHNSQNDNYLISSVLTNEVNYFAFYDNENDSVYLVGYGIVRQYCKSLKTAYKFHINEGSKLFVPDTWAKQQKINTYKL